MSWGRQLEGCVCSKPDCCLGGRAWINDATKCCELAVTFTSAVLWRPLHPMSWAAPCPCCPTHILARPMPEDSSPWPLDEPSTGHDGPRLHTWRSQCQWCQCWCWCQCHGAVCTQLQGSGFGTSPRCHQQEPRKGQRDARTTSPAFHELQCAWEQRGHLGHPAVPTSMVRAHNDGSQCLGAGSAYSPMEKWEKHLGEELPACQALMCNSNSASSQKLGALTRHPTYSSHWFQNSPQTWCQISPQHHSLPPTSGW